MPLTDEQRIENFQKMQARITAAQRVKRRLNAGPRVRKLPDALSILKAVHRLSDEADRARNAMREEQLDPEDMHLGLLFSVSTPSDNGLQESIGAKWLGPPGKISEFVMALELLENHSSLNFIGIVWAVLDREANRGIMWSKPLANGQEETMKLAQRLFQAPYRIN